MTSTETKYRILVADVDTDCYDLLDGVVYRVVRVVTGREVLDYLNRTDPKSLDLVILDVVLTDIDGFAVLEQIRSNESFSNLPVLMVTRQDSTTDKDRSFFSGASDCITKPFNDRELLARVANLCKLQRAKRILPEHKKLLASAFDGIISVDCDGNVIQFNAMAEKILGYKASEVLGKSVHPLYSNPKEPEKIGRLLDENIKTGLRDYDTFVRNKEGDNIPICLSATWLWDDDGKCIGSVGYFRDMRDRKMLLESINAVAQADNLEQGLQNLARTIVESLIASFCCILLKSTDRDSLIFKAAYPYPRSDRLAWNPCIGDACRPFSDPQSSALLTQYETVLLKEGEKVDQKILAHIADWVKLQGALKSALIVPLEGKKEILGYCVLGEMRAWKRSPFSEWKIEQAQSLTKQASTLIEKIQLLELTQRRLDELKTLQNLAITVSATLDLDTILDQVCRSAVELFSVDHSGLVLFDKDFTRGKVVSEFPGMGLKDSVFNIQDIPLENQLINERKPIFVYDVDEEERLGPARTALLNQHNIHSILLVPVVSKDKVLGSFGLDSIGQQRRFSAEEMELCEIFAAHVATAIENAGLFREVSLNQQNIRSSFEASNKLVSSENPNKVLRDIVELSRNATKATWVTVILIDQLGNPHNLVRAGEGGKHEPGELIVRSDGISMQVMRTGKAHPIPNPRDQQAWVNPRMIEFNVGAAICLPLSLRGQPIGVMWLHYENPREFQANEIDVLQLFANQSAIAYDNSRRIEELEHLRKAADALAKVSNLKDVLHQISKHAQIVLRADSASLLPWDRSRARFDLDRSVATGSITKVWDDFKKISPRSSGTAAMVLESGWFGVEDINDRDRYDFIEETTRNFLNRIGLISFQGIRLAVDRENLGVLFVNYSKPRIISEEERNIAKVFADHAALALKNANLLEEISQALEQVKKAHKTAQAVAEVTVRGNMKETLTAIVDGTYHTLGCDAIVLYEFNQEKEILNHPPIMKGVKVPWKAQRFNEVKIDSLVYFMLQQDEPYVVEDVSKHPQFRDSRFSREEEIKTCVASPLLVMQQKVGLLFINYRDLHHFTKNELTIIQLYANQAAIAIHNKQILEQEQKHTKALKAHFEAGKVITSSLSLKEILQTIINQTRMMTGVVGVQAERSYLIFVNGNKVELQVADPPGEYENILKKIELIDLDEVDNIFSIVAKKKKSQFLYGDDKNPENHNYFGEQLGSLLVVPIIIKNEVFGMMIVEHSEKNGFDDNDQRTLESLANQASIVIDNARQYEILQRSIQYQRAMYHVSKEISTGFTTGQQNVLDRILKSVVEHISQIGDSPKELVGSILLYDKGKNALILESYYNPNGTSQNPMGKEQAIDRRADRIGISGRAFLLRKPQRISDVRDHTDYIELNEATLSEIDVPLLINREPIGVLSLEANVLDAFNIEDEIALLSLAELAVISIRNVQQYDYLKRIKGFIGSKTAEDWIKMVSQVWGHSVRREVGTSLGQIALLRKMYGKDPLPPNIEEEFNQLESTVRGIREIPIIAPLSSEDGISNIRINDLLSSYLDIRFKHPHYKHVKIKTDLQFEMDDIISVRASPEWMRRAFEIIVENSVEIMLRENTLVKELYVKTCKKDQFVEISFQDTGPGIPEHLLESLFVEPIQKPEGSVGAGIGLVLASTICETYGGEIYIESTGDDGTNIIIRLPFLEKKSKLYR